MAVPSALQSLVVRQALALKDKWAAQHDHDWLVWEPGAWRVPSAGEKLAETRAAGPQGFDPLLGDCLCFELRGTDLAIGRAPENAIVVNDATVSRAHVQLRRSNDRWLALAHRPAKLGDSPLEPGAARALASGDRLVLGGVTLTFWSAQDFSARIQMEARKLL